VTGGPRLGVMLYSVLDAALADLAGTLDRIASLGYLGVETYGVVEHWGAARVRDEIARAGLELTSAHTPFPSGPDALRLLDDAAELGATTLVWSMEREEFDTVDTLVAGVERVNDAAALAGARGMRIAYHNHFAEFQNRLDGRIAYDVLLEHLDPRVVLEVDAYWARMGGADVAAVLADLGDRVQYVHVKDGPARSYEDDVMVPIGTGEMDWPTILGANRALAWHLVELERLPMEPFAALEQSYAYLTATGLTTGAR